MAKIVIEVETDPKTLKVTINGEEIGDVSNVNIYKYCGCGEVEPEMWCEISTETKDVENKINKRVTFSTANTQEVKEALANKKAIRDDKFPGFTGYHKTISDDISSFLS